MGILNKLTTYYVYLFVYIYILIYIFIDTAWDLLRIDVQGFSEFCHYFLEKHQGYFVSPLRLSGSAIESVFGQLKFSAGGKQMLQTIESLGQHFS